MTCPLNESHCRRLGIPCGIAEFVYGNACNLQILKEDTPADYLPGEKQPPSNLKYCLYFFTVYTLTCRLNQTIRIVDSNETKKW